MSSVVSVYGENTLVQFEDFGNENAFRLMTKYEHKYCSFNDDIRGTAAVTMAGIYASLKGKDGIHALREHSFLIIGAGSAGIGIADMITTAMMEESGGQMLRQRAREYLWLADSKGLIFAERRSGGISALKRPYAHRRLKGNDSVKDIAAMVMEVGATAIIGVSGQPKQFTKSVILAMKANTAYPLIFSLSNPTSMSECTAQEAYDWTQNQLYFASGSPFKLREGTFGDSLDDDVVPSQGNNAYIFPGVALGIIASESKRVPEGIFLIAARTLALMVDDRLLKYGVIYPEIERMREVSVQIGIAVAKEVHRRGLTDQPVPDDFRALVTGIQYDHANYPDLSDLNVVNANHEHKNEL